MNKSFVTFLSNDIHERLETVPGVGDVTKKRLVEHDIHTTYQLLGCFLSICGKEMDGKMRIAAFMHFLEELTVPASTRGKITQAVSEKLNIMMPGLLAVVADDDDDGTEFVDAEDGGTADHAYLNTLVDVYDDVDDLPFQVYTPTSFDFITSMSKEGVMHEFERRDSGLVFDRHENVVVNENILLAFYKHYGKVAPLEESYYVMEIL